MFPAWFPLRVIYRGGELQSRVDQRQEVIVQARLQTDDVIDDSIFHLKEPITDQVRKFFTSVCCRSRCIMGNVGSRLILRSVLTRLEQNVKGGEHSGPNPATAKRLHHRPESGSNTGRQQYLVQVHTEFPSEQREGSGPNWVTRGVLKNQLAGVFTKISSQYQSCLRPTLDPQIN